jgi:hypothetical protein
MGDHCQAQPSSIGSETTARQHAPGQLVLDHGSGEPSPLDNDQKILHI